MKRRTLAGACAPRWAWLVSILIFAALSSLSLHANAEIPVVKAKGWELSLDGRLSTFISFSEGDAQPASVATWTGVEDRAAGTDHIAMTRIRSGFINNVLGFSVVKELSPNLKVTGRIATWVGVSQARDKLDNPSLDTRELYIKLEGPWGSVLAGRNLSLFERGAIALNYDLEHGYGLGHPCAIRTVRGGACGHAGHGLLFPSFNAGIVYATPELAGVQLSLGAYDPVAISERQYERTPYPRFEAELTYRLRDYFHVFADALWQRVGSNSDPNLNPDVNGIAAGGAVTLGPFAAGGAFYRGQGLGLYVPLENSPLFSDEFGVLRVSQGYVGMASLTIRETKVAAGFGVSQLKMTQTESEPFAMLTFPKQQMGISAGVYQGISHTLFLALEYFRGNYEWYDSVDPTSMMTVHNQQGVNFFNAGLTLVF